MNSEVTGAPRPATTGGRHGMARSLMVWQVVSALFLLGMAYIHLHLVLTGVGGVLGKLFVLNAIGGLMLGIAMVVLRQQLLLVASVLSLLFMALGLALDKYIHVCSHRNAKYATRRPDPRITFSRPRSHSCASTYPSLNNVSWLHERPMRQLRDWQQRGVQSHVHR